MKFLIIEDEILAAQRLVILLNQLSANKEEIPVCDSIESAVHWLRNNPTPDCIFMDIELSDGLSFKIADEFEIKCPVIFTTAYDHYAIKSFELLTLGYLLKPVTINHLKSALGKLDTIKNAFQKSNTLDLTNSIEEKEYKNRFLIKVGNRMFFIHVDDIAYFTCDDKTVYLFSNDGKRFIIDFSLDTLMGQLDPKVFFRLNRKVIARVNAIKEIKTYTNRRLKLALNNGNQNYEVIVSREKVGAFKSWVGS
jgi:two-component system, LytTR family, response regulator LytT